jgi:exodeoxyribonuclease V beta subunit
MKSYLALKASAGSGKTFALTVRYISLLLLDSDPSEILTLTFTNKAAAQMNQRIYDTLISLGEDDAVLNAICEQTALTKKRILAKKESLIQSYLQSELAIYTIDKFVNKILREFSGYVGINDDFSIEFDDEELLLYKFLLSLDEEQFGDLIKFASIENKKFQSIVELFKILGEKSESLETLALQNNEYRYDTLQVIKSKVLEHALKIKDFMDQSNISKSGLNAVDFEDIETLLDKGKTWLTKESLSEFTYFKKAKPPLELDKDLQEIKKYLGIYFQIGEAITLEHLFKIFQDYQNFRDKYNKKRNSLEFGDITTIVYQLMDKHIQKDFIYFRLDTKYNHILIDEFQDTSTIQFKILYHLIEEIISGDPEIFKTFFYVGDVKQSIYRFRGGQKELFDYVSEIFSPMLEVDLLDTNYRSSQNVVEFVNTIFERLPNYKYDHQKVASEKQGYVEVLESENDDIYETLYKKLEMLLDEGVDEENIAILTYTNNDVLEVYEYFKSKKPTLNIVTEMTSKLINQQNVNAAINGVKYLYFKEEIYKANFHTLRGCSFDKAFDFSINIENNTIQTIVKKLCEYYQIIDDNVLRFIELVSKYDGIVDFVYNIDKDDTPIVSKSKNGLSILTIFKSKGLEFDTVFVLDRLSRKNADRSSLLFDYDGIEIQKIYYKKSGRDNFDPYYNEAVQREKKLVIADELNILYVALTRAKNNMIVLKKSKSSVFEYLGDLKVQQVGELYIAPKKDTRIDQKEQVTYTPMYLGYQEKDQTEEESDTILVRYFGIATHYCLEMMERFDQISLDKTFFMIQNRFSNILNISQFDEIYARINNLIHDTQFQALIQGCEFTKEQPIIYQGEHKIIDLLLEKDEQYIVIDYKTTSEQSDAHKEQVSTYKEAIEKITKYGSIKGYVVYLAQDKTKIIEV